MFRVALVACEGVVAACGLGTVGFAVHEGECHCFAADGQTVYCTLVRLVADAPGERIDKLQVAFEHGMGALTLPHIGDRDGEPIWMMDALLVRLLEYAPANS